MATVELEAAAVEDLDRLTLALSLPTDTRQRVRQSLTPLWQFPRLGPELHGRWSGLQFILGPLRWMLIVYRFEEPADRVVVVTIQDARSSRAVAPCSPANSGSPADLGGRVTSVLVRSAVSSYVAAVHSAGLMAVGCGGRRR